MLCDILALGCAIFAAVHFAPTVTAMGQEWISAPTTVAIWGVGTLIAGGMFVLVSGVGKLMDRLTSTVGLGILNRVAGLIFGVVKGFGLILPLAFVLNMAAPEQLQRSVILPYYQEVLKYIPKTGN